MVNPNTGVAYSTLQELCDFYTSQGGAAYPFVATPPKSCVRTDNFGNKTTYNASSKWMCGSVAAGYNATTGTYTCGMGCESGQNWTLSGSTCTRPDCPNGRNSNGTCNECTTLKLTSGACAEPCTAGQENTQFNKSTTVGTETTYCGSNNCSKTVVSRTPVATGCAYGSSGFGLCQTGYTVTLKTTGAYCDYEAGGTPNTNQPSADKNDSPCPTGYGVASGANGFLRCLPPGTSTPSKTETTTVDPQGNATKTESTDSTVSKTTCTGDTCTKTTSTVDASGAVSTVVSTSSKSTFCENNPNNSACGGEGSDLSFTAPSAGKFGRKSDEITEAQNAVSDELNLIKTQASALLGKLSTGSGSLPCPEAIEVLGSSFRLCSSTYQNQLSPIASAVLLIGALGAIVVIFR